MSTLRPHGVVCAATARVPGGRGSAGSTAGAAAYAGKAPGRPWARISRSTRLRPTVRPFCRLSGSAAVLSVGHGPVAETVPDRQRYRGALDLDHVADGEGSGDPLRGGRVHVHAAVRDVAYPVVGNVPAGRVAVLAGVGDPQAQRDVLGVVVGVLRVGDPVARRRHVHRLVLLQHHVRPGAGEEVDGAAVGALGRATLAAADRVVLDLRAVDVHQHPVAVGADDGDARVADGEADPVVAGAV